MPAYDFVCQDCGSSFEVRLSISAYSAGEGRRCSECGSIRVERSFTAVNVIAGSRSGAAPVVDSGAPGACCNPDGFT